MSNFDVSAGPEEKLVRTIVISIIVPDCADPACADLDCAGAGVQLLCAACCCC